MAPSEAAVAEVVVMKSSVVKTTSEGAIVESTALESTAWVNAAQSTAVESAAAEAAAVESAPTEAAAVESAATTAKAATAAMTAAATATSECHGGRRKPSDNNQGYYSLSQHHHSPSEIPLPTDALQMAIVQESCYRRRRVSSSNRRDSLVNCTSGQTGKFVKQCADEIANCRQM